MKLVSNIEIHDETVGTLHPHSFAMEERLSNWPILPAHNFIHFTNFDKSPMLCNCRKSQCVCKYESKWGTRCTSSMIV